MARRDDDSSIPKGRFFKKDDPVLRNVEIVKYDLMDVCEIEVAVADNNFANVYHKDMQFEEDLDSQVENDAGIHGDLTNEETVRSVLGPDNFTEDWARQREKATRTYIDLEDDGADEDEDENAPTAPAGTAGTASSEADAFKPLVTETAEPVQATEVADDSPPPTGIAAVNQDAGQSQLGDNEEQISQIKDSFHAVSHNQQYDVEPLVAAPDTAGEGDAALGTEQEPSNATEPSPVPELSTEPPPAVSADELDQLRNEAKADGFDEGLKEAQQAMATLTDQLGKSIAEVEGLKEQLLDNSRQNFKAIAKTMVSAILQKQIALDPGALDRIISRAIKETIKSDTFTVKVSSATHESLKEVSEFADKLVVDDSVSEGHFKVESDLSVIDGDLGQIIGNLLDEADLNLFADDEAS